MFAFLGVHLEFFSQNLTTIGPVVSKIICLINIDTERQMDRQTGVMKRRENLRVASHPIDSGRNLHNPSNSREYAKIKENRREFWKIQEKSQESEGVLKNTGKYRRKRKTPRGPDRIQKNPRESERTRENTREYEKNKRIKENSGE